MNPTEGRDKRSASSAAVAAAVAVSAAAASAVAAELEGGLPEKFAKLLDKLPADEYKTATEVLEEILRGGSGTIRQIVLAVGQEFGDPDGVKPKYAVHGLVHHVSRPGADAQRKLVAKTLAEELEEDHSDDLKEFLCRQLQLCGRNEEVAALAKLLESDRLCEPATQALCTIGTPDAIAALRAALPKATAGRRTTLVNALGWFGDKASAAEVRKDVAAKDPELRICAWYALGNMGDAASADALLKAMESKSTYERSQALDACLRLARSLAEAGDTAGGEKICRELLGKLKAAEEVHDRCAALAALADVIGVKAVGDVMEALDSKDLALRHHSAWTAVDLAAAIGKDHAGDARKLLEKVQEASSEEVVLEKAGLLLGK